METFGITGATSFIGRHLRHRITELGGTSILFSGDICNPFDVVEFVKQCDTIIHLAGLNRGESFNVYRVNAVGGANVIAAAAMAGNRHVILSSTKYINRHPDSPYSRGKVSEEIMLKQLAGYAGCRSSIFRFSNIYGPGALPHYVSVIATFCWFEANGLGAQMPIQGDGLQIIDFTPINTVVDYILAARNNQDIFTFTQVDGISLSIRQIADIVRDPATRSAFPVIHEMVDFFSKPNPLMEFNNNAYAGNTTSKDEIPLPSSDQGIDGALQREIQVESNQVSYSQLLRSNGLQWLFLLNGKIVIDVYTLTGEYIQSCMLEEHHTRAIRLSPEYKYDLRNLGSEPAHAQLKSMLT